MNPAIALLTLQACLGAFDTLYYHEYKLRLPHGNNTALELRLHAMRDFAYTLIIGSLAWFTWNGALTWALAGILLFEIVITLWDFIEEDQKRKLPAGERAMHTIMAIVYGAFLANLIPQMLAWSKLSTGLTQVNNGFFSPLLSIMAIGVLLSGIRDMAASFSSKNA